MKDEKELDFELPTYREHLYSVCTKANLDDKDEVIALLQYLAGEAARNNDFMLHSDKKLKELMTASEYEKWSTEVAKELFAEDIRRMAEGEFKDFCIENFGDITR